MRVRTATPRWWVPNRFLQNRWARFSLPSFNTSIARFSYGAKPMTSRMMSRVNCTRFGTGFCGSSNVARAGEIVAKAAARSTAGQRPTLNPSPAPGALASALASPRPIHSPPCGASASSSSCSSHPPR